MSHTIKFAHNYNNKLMCISFTTIRLRDDYKYVVGDMYDVIYTWLDPEDNYRQKENNLGPARILDIKHFTLNDLNVYMSHIDMGMHQIDGKKEIQKLYSGAYIDWSIQQLSYILLEQQDTQIRYIMPSRLKKIDRKAHLFNQTPQGYQLVNA